MELTAGNFTVHINGYNPAGDPVPPAADVTCIRQAGQSSTSTRYRRSHTDDHDTHRGLAGRVRRRSRRDRRRRDHRQQRQAGRHRGVHLRGQDREGGGQGRQGQGHARPGADHGVRTVSAKFTPTDTNLAPSEATKAVTVVRGQPTTTATARLPRRAQPAGRQGPRRGSERHCGRRRGQVRAEAQRRQDPHGDHRPQLQRQAPRRCSSGSASPAPTSWSPAISAPTRSRGPSTGSS